MKQKKNLKSDTKISLLVPTIRVKQIKEMIENIELNTYDKKHIEMVIDTNEDSYDVIKYVRSVQKQSSFPIKLLVSPKLFGYFSMWVNDQRLWKNASKDSYFIALWGDEVRLEKGWDKYIRSYHGHFSDHLFRIRLSPHVRYSYCFTTLQTCFRPDSFSIFTKDWLEQTRGFGFSWGADCYHEQVALFLAKGFSRYSLFEKTNFRDVRLSKNIIKDLVFGADVSSQHQKISSELMLLEWSRLLSPQGKKPALEAACRIAARIEILNNKERSLTSLETPKGVSLFDKDTMEQIHFYNSVVPILPSIFEMLKFKLYLVTSNFKCIIFMRSFPRI